MDLPEIVRFQMCGQWRRRALSGVAHQSHDLNLV